MSTPPLPLSEFELKETLNFSEYQLAQIYWRPSPAIKIKENENLHPAVVFINDIVHNTIAAVVVALIVGLIISVL